MSSYLGIFAGLVVLLGLGSMVHGYQCAQRPRKFGCFRDNGRNRLMQLKFTKRMKKEDWIGQGWNNHLHTLYCDCSKEAKKESRRYFGLQNFNECWTGNLDHVRNVEGRRAKNTRCWSEGSNYLECTQAKQVCVGTPWYMEIYETSFDSVVILTETEGPPILVATINPNAPRPPPKIPAPPPGLSGR